MNSAESIISSIRGMLVPIRREGFPFIAILLVVTLFFGWFWAPIFWIGLILTAWCTYFFRDPRRYTPLDKDLVISPADGRVSRVSIGVAPKELGLGEQTRRRVSIFMSIFDCHVNRSPLAGRVIKIIYTPGKFINAELDKASEGNERNGFLLETEHGPVGVVQIAGLVARLPLREARHRQFLMIALLGWSAIEAGAVSTAACAPSSARALPTPSAA